MSQNKLRIDKIDDNKCSVSLNVPETGNQICELFINSEGDYIYEYNPFTPILRELEEDELNDIIYEWVINNNIPNQYLNQ